MPKRSASEALISSTHRRFILLTLSHNELQERSLTKDVVHQRIEQRFHVVRAIACTEQHQEGGHHFHYAFENTDASKNTATKVLRSTFPEWDGMSLDIKFHKSWTTMAKYVTKEDKNYTIYNDYNEQQLQEELRAIESKSLNAVRVIRAHVASGGSIASLVHNDVVAPIMLRSSTSVRLFAEYVQQSMPSESTLDTIIRVSKTVTDEEIKDFMTTLTQPMVDSLQHFVRQLQGRTLRQPHVYCHGSTHTGKSYLFTLIAQNTRCFIPCLENNDRAFADYDDNRFDWIFINDFHDNVRFQTLSNLCEGIPMKLNGYGLQKTKSKNCPIVFTSNRLPEYKNLDSSRLTALMTRLTTIQYTQQIPATSQDPADAWRVLSGVLNTMINK